MNISFLKKYQPQFFSEFEIDQEYINILKTLINIDNLNILIIGDIGSGKTSLLLAIIKEYYSTVKNKQLINENIMHINNLKEQGIQYYRNEVKIFCQTKSSIQNKKKIIMIDDFDYINEQSQQVFRNCMDKYSHNVLFLASCTNAQKIIDSIQSRMTLIKLKAFTNAQLYQIIDDICISEQITIEPNAKKFIIAVCNHSVKILLNYMEKFTLLDENITLDIAEAVCTNISFREFEKYTILCKDKNNLPEAISKMHSLIKLGYSVMDILDCYFLFIKNTDIITENKKYNIIALICKYITVFHNIHEDDIELSFFTNNLINMLSND